MRSLLNFQTDNLGPKEWRSSMMLIVSDSLSILLKAQEFEFETKLLDNEPEVKFNESVLIVSHPLAGWDLSSYYLSYSVIPQDEAMLASLLKSLKEISNLSEEKKTEGIRGASYLRLLREAGKHLQSVNIDEKKRLLELGKDFYHEFLPLLSMDYCEHLLSSLLAFPLVKNSLKGLRFHRGDQLPLLKEGDILLPLDEKERFYLHGELADKKIKGEGAVLLSLLFHFVKDFLKLSGEIKVTDWHNDEPWEEILSKLQIPFAFLGTDGTLLLHHQDFSRLAITPRECLQLQSGDKIERLGQVFSIFSQKINEKILVIFRTEKTKGPSNFSSRELGVVSSSIAHELNNPLAGMLAAISLLFLEDLDEEESKALQDMKKSIERCKGLVEIFLGFSRMSPHLHISGSLPQSFTQAMNLLRFRMVESNVRLNIETVDLDKFQGKFNPSIMAMFFYIVLNELLTLCQKNDLLMDASKNKGMNLTGIVRSDIDRIELILEQKMELLSLSHSRLVSHLVDLLEMRLEFTLGKLVVRRINL